jgi:uncharacterized membrane-anchored protein
MKKYKWIIIMVNMVLLFAYFNYSIYSKEKTLQEGKLILLELAPVDPRSLMQGDYMRLNYVLSSNITTDSLPRRGYCVVVLDEHNRARSLRFQKETKPINKGEYLIKYTTPDKWLLNIGAESFFFQEGHGKRYEEAKYGALKVDNNGNSILVGLYNEKLKEIK